MSVARPLPFRTLFVSGSPKSGTTWLQKILDAHPAIACAGEGHFVERIANPMARMLREYNDKLRQVDERVFQGKAPYQPLGEQELLQLIRDMVIRLMLRQQPPPGIAWLGDKTPRYTEGLKELKLLFPDVRFLHIVRDPRDVAVSRLYHAKRAGYDDALTAGSATYYEMVANAATAWALHNGNVEAFAAAAPANAGMLHRVRYEVMLVEFDRVVTNLLAFLDVDNSPAVVASIRHATDFERLSGRKQGEEDPDSFFRKGIAGDWEGRLDAKALDIIAGHCGLLMRKLGYAAAP
jgi:hypothetical protein